MPVVCDLISAISTEKHNNHMKVLRSLLWSDSSDNLVKSPFVSFQSPNLLEKDLKHSFVVFLLGSQVPAPVFKLNTLNDEQIKALVDLFHVIMRDVVRLDTEFDDHGSLLSWAKFVIISRTGC